MTKSYKALLKGNQLDWIADAPELAPDQPLVVQVVVEEDHIDKTMLSDGKTMAECLEKIAESNPFAEIKDPVKWQREIRKDRPLPFRDESC